MNWIFGALAALFFFGFVYLRFLAVPLALRWLRASAPGADPVWRQVRECSQAVARRHRLPEPVLWVLPEFAPNVLVLRGGGKTHLCLTEGLVRVLGTEELAAILSVALYQSRQAGRTLQTWGSLAIFPLAVRVSQAPLPIRILLAPVLSAMLRSVSRSRALYQADAAAARLYTPFQVAATLQKLSVLGRKMPMKRWNLALDSLYVVAPLALDDGPQWVSLGQPSVADRREELLGS